MQFSYDKLKGKIIEKYGSRKEFAKALGCEESTLSKKLNGKSSFSQSEIFFMIEDLGVKPEEVQSYFFAIKVR